MTRTAVEQSIAQQRQASLWPTRRSKPDSPRRAPFPGWRPKPSKLEARGDVPAIPAHIRAAEHDLGPDDRVYIRRKLGRMLGKFAPEIVRVSVRTEDLNGPRGGADRVCRIKVVLYGLPSVVFEKRNATLNAAVDGALAGVERAVRRALLRRRARPRRRTAASRSVPGIDSSFESAPATAEQRRKAGIDTAGRDAERAAGELLRSGSRHALLALIYDAVDRRLMETFPASDAVARY